MDHAAQKLAGLLSPYLEGGESSAQKRTPGEKIDSLQLKAARAELHQQLQDIEAAWLTATKLLAEARDTITRQLAAVDRTAEQVHPPFHNHELTSGKDNERSQRGRDAVARIMAGEELASDDDEDGDIDYE